MSAKVERLLARAMCLQLGEQPRASLEALTSLVLQASQLCCRQSSEGQR